ncbi:hypothetical protein ACOSQ3_020903 [Xanthoceras sorbifolium]
MKRGSRSLMIVLGTLQYFTTSLRNNRAACFAVQFIGAAMKVAYFQKQSTTTMIDPQPSDFGKAEMKSMMVFSHGLSEMGNGSSNPPGDCCSFLSCWHTR